MKMSLKKKISCFLVMFLLVNTLAGPLTATAASKSAVLKVGSTFTSGKYVYKVTALKGKSGSVALTGVKNKSVTTVKIANTVKTGKYKFSVKEIGSGAFKGCRKLVTVTANKGLKTIGKNAFNGCKKLKEINIKGTKLKSVGKNALKGISRKAVITVPDNMKSTYARILKNKGQEDTIQLTAIGTPAPGVEVPKPQDPEQTETSAPETQVPEQTETNKSETQVPEQTETNGSEAQDPGQPETSAPETQIPEQTETSKPETQVPEQPGASRPETQVPGQPETVHVHVFSEWKEITPASCKAAGRQQRTCTECGETESQVIPALSEHKLIKLDDVEPTCTTWGRHNVKKCEICGQEFFDIAGEEPLGHQFSNNYTVDVEATETKAGIKSRHCEREGCTETTDAREIPATGKPQETETESETEHEHKFGAWTRTVEPTCITMGRETRTCEECKATETRDVPSVLNNHKRVNLPDIKPTCVTWGKYNRWKCEICGQEFFDVAGQGPLGHQFSDDYTVDVEATCTKAGVESRHCEREGCTETTGAREIQAKEHTWGEPAVTPATCTSYGYTKFTCTVCGAEKITDKTNLKEHQWGDEIVTPATCTRSGTSRKVCGLCGKTSVLNTIPATGHEWIEESGEATCEHDGFKLKKCKYCGLVTDKTVVPALAHTFEGGKTTNSAKHCYERGTVTQHCSKCGKDVVVEEMSYGQHNYGGDNICDDCGLSRNSSFSGYIWWVTYKADLEKCVGFSGSGKGDTRSWTVRGDVPICVKAPEAKAGHSFKEWKITAGSKEILVDAGKPERVDTYEKVLRETGLLDGNKQNWVSTIVIEAIYD